MQQKLSFFHVWISRYSLRRLLPLPFAHFCSILRKSRDFPKLTLLKYIFCVGVFMEIEDETQESWASLDINEVAQMEVPNQSSYLSSILNFWQR